VTLHIAKGLSLPLDAVTQTFAQIGRKGAGKTYLATMIAEQMLDAEAQTVALDPVGNWFGLRIGADGKSKGKDIFVIGGEHGDVPLTPESGARVAQLLVEKRISAVLDVSAFRIGERKRFAAAFGEELFHLKKVQRTPMHLFVEEAQLFAPQRPGPDEARMLGAFESIVRLGRNYGIGASLITQRPQSVNKEVLSQVECLCVLQVNGTHERKALEEWVQEAGADRKLIGELPGLERGEGYVWSPSWLRIFQRVHFSKKTTFDASATPEVGKAAPAAKLSAVDVEALRADLAEVVAAAEQDDPKALRRRIAELQGQLSRSGGQWESVAKEALAELERVKKAKAAPAPKVEVRDKPVLKDSQVERLESLGARAEKAVEAFVVAAREVRPAMLRAIEATRNVQPVTVQAALARPERQFSAPAPRPDVKRPAAAPRAPTANGDLKPAQLRLLEALAVKDGLTPRQLAIRTGYSPGTGGFNNIMYSLTGSSHIERRGSGLFITDVGRAAVPNPPPSGPAELRELWRGKLAPSQWKLLAVAIEVYPNAISRERLATETGYSPGTGGFNNLMYSLTGAGLLEKAGDGLRAAAELIG
jgi:hypothetical protein